MASFSDFTILHPQDHHSGIIQDGRVARECGISTMPQGEARLIGCIELLPEWKGIINYNAITIPTSVCWLPIPKAIEISWKDVLSLIAPLLPFIINGPHITRSGQMLLLLLPCIGSRKQRSSPATKWCPWPLCLRIEALHSDTSKYSHSPLPWPMMDIHNGIIILEDSHGITSKQPGSIRPH